MQCIILPGELKKPNNFDSSDKIINIGKIGSICLNLDFTNRTPVAIEKPMSSLKLFMPSISVYTHNLGIHLQSADTLLMKSGD